MHGPADPEGLADLYKHPGILDFSQPFGAFERRQWDALAATASGPLEANLRLLAGGGFRGGERYGAWPTSPIPSGCRRTAPRDCSRRRWTCWCWTARCRRRSGRRATNNDLHAGIGCIDSLRPRRAVLTHVGHTLDAWLLDHPAALPEGVELARDGVCLPL